jgi:hypothetical protein
LDLPGRRFPGQGVRGPTIFPASGDFVNFSPSNLLKLAVGEIAATAGIADETVAAVHKPGPQHPMEKPKSY